MTKEKYARLRSKIVRSYRRKTGCKIGNVDDCVGFVFKSWVTCPNKLVDHAVVDYVRTELGVYQNIDRHNIYFAGVFNPDIHGGSDSSNPTLLEKCLKTFEDWDRACFILYHKWGFTLLDISDVFGIGEAGVCKKMQKLALRIEELKERVEQNASP